ncbi:hypothetical protein LV779_36635 [Streptomyces thinghirensis]|nr:hypothetical protein [Streptomyces thinghirensis]
MRRRLARGRGGGWWPYLFLAPWFVGLFGLTIYPMLDSLYLSFTDFDLLTPARWVGMDNYSKMFTDDPVFWDSVHATLLYVVVSVPLKLALALAVAMLLNRDLKASACTGPPSTCRPCSAGRSPSPSCGGSSSAATACSTTSSPGSASRARTGSPAPTPRSTR